MSNMSHMYFKLPIEKARPIVDEAKKAYDEFRSLANSLVAELGAVDFAERGRRGNIGGFLFAQNAAGPDPRKTGLKCYFHTMEQNGEQYDVYVANGKTKSGQKLQQRIGHINSKSIDLSSKMCTEFGVSSEVIGDHSPSKTGMALYFSVACHIKDSPFWVFKVPHRDGKTQYGKEIIPHPDLIEIKHSEFIAITEESGQ